MNRNKVRYNAFIKEFKLYLNRLNLKNWAINYSKSNEESVSACCQVLSVSNRIVVIYVNPENLYSVNHAKSTARHEAAHLFITELAALIDNSKEAQLILECEKICTVLEKYNLVEVD